MRATLLLALGATAVAACSPSAPPAVNPRPVPAPASAPAAQQGEEDRAVLVAQSGAPREAGSASASAPAPAAVISATEVTRRATEVFGAPAPDPASGMEAEGEDEAPSWDIAVAPYETHARVEHFVKRFTGSAKGYVASRLGRGTRFEPMIREKMRAGGVPEDMYYLAFVESGFDPHAYSRAAAVGMWQFMSSTARGMGLRVDWWVDERRDPVRATDAAVRFLRSLNDQFGSLYLAAAAYNGGPGRVARGLNRFADSLETAEGEDRFFELAEQDFLPKETKDYVPQIIAAALVGKDPARYGIEVEAREPFAYDSVKVPALTSIPAIARAAGTSVAVMRDLNPQFLRGVTPPDRASQVRIPVGSAARFDEAFSELPADERAGARRERVAKLSSIARLAAQLETTPRAIEAFNPGLRRTRKGNVIAGQTVVVPDADVLAAALDVPDPSIERYGSASASRSAAVVRTHVVKRGETLSHVARRHRTTVAALMRLNRLRKPLIFAGQELVVKGAPSKRGKARVASGARNPAARPAKASSRSAKSSAKSPAKSATRKSALKASGKKTTAKKPTAKNRAGRASTTKKSTGMASTAKKPTGKASAARKPTATKPTPKKSSAGTPKKTTGATSKSK